LPAGALADSLGHQHRSWPVVRLKAHFQERLIRALVRPYQPLDRASIQAHRCSSRHDSCCSGAHHTRRAPATRIPRSIACHRCSRRAAEKQLWHLASGGQWHRAHQCCAAARFVPNLNALVPASAALLRCFNPSAPAIRSTARRESCTCAVITVAMKMPRSQRRKRGPMHRAHRPGSFRGRLR
jgi:hypothetical protein